MTPDQWRSAIGIAVEERRKELRFRSVRAAAAAAGVSEGAWRQIESGRRQVAKNVIQTTNPGLDIQSAVCKALGWSPDSIERLRDGKKPRLLPPEPQELGFDLESRGDIVEMRAAMQQDREKVDRLRRRVAHLEQIVERRHQQLLEALGLTNDDVGIDVDDEQFALAAEGGGVDPGDEGTVSKPRAPIEQDDA